MSIKGYTREAGRGERLSLARSLGVEAHLINDVREIDPSWLENTEVVGLTSGASAPESLVSKVVDFFRDLHIEEITEIGFEEPNVHFALPKGIEI